MCQQPSAFLPSLRPRPNSHVLTAAFARIDAILPLSDPLEVRYTTNWLTRLLSNSSEEHASLNDSAARLLILLTAGTAGSGDHTKQYDFANPTGNLSISIKETNIADGIGHRTWGSAPLLARLMAASPSSFGLDSQSTLRILELGSGTGLVGLTIAKLLLPSNASSRIVLSDYHEATLDNLRANVKTNGCDAVAKVQKLDWRHAYCDETYDIIVAADVTYELDLIPLIVSSVSQHLKKGGVFHLMMPVRKRHEAEISAVQAAFDASDFSNKLVAVTSLIW
ncbi:hypothetical protein E5Q_02924 [Mixia osmundae IAM 14324]|uniref:Methyltransferase domain-containing protein n=1 Tax=Mixia osmundae (strain CBS 9802 / IAM 14324 / JCM 22182 / KY 12970) TaxID=764103 RepID=G7E0A0_MIXOS|nr:hypothetical protein E5Q_02924 [Mixia osmundae IAM 14324]